jgi:proline dehydrogenase
MSWRWRFGQMLLRNAPRLLPRADAAYAMRVAEHLRQEGYAVTIGHFPADHGHPNAIVAANCAIAEALASSESDAYLAVKAPPLGFDAARLEAIRLAADKAGLPMVFDAHQFTAADQTLACVNRLLEDHPGTGVVLPARWWRSMDDAMALRDSSARLRLVKGEWAEPGVPEGDAAERFLALARKLAGREAPVGIATHDPALAEAALRILLAAGTPCELEQIRGFPRRRTVAVARKLGVRVRIYVPFGEGWWPYALGKALERPYLPMWWLRDLLA